METDQSFWEKVFERVASTSDGSTRTPSSTSTTTARNRREPAPHPKPGTQPDPQPNRKLEWETALSRLPGTEHPTAPSPPPHSNSTSSASRPIKPLPVRASNRLPQEKRARQPQFSPTQEPSAALSTELDINNTQKFFLDPDELRKGLPVLMRMLPQIFVATDVDYYVTFFEHDFCKQTSPSLPCIAHLILASLSTLDEIKRQYPHATWSMRRKQVQRLLDHVDERYIEIVARAHNSQLHPEWRKEYIRGRRLIWWQLPPSIHDIFLVLCICVIVSCIFVDNPLCLIEASLKLIRTHLSSLRKWLITKTLKLCGSLLAEETELYVSTVPHNIRSILNMTKGGSLVYRQPPDLPQLQRIIVDSVTYSISRARGTSLPTS